MPQSPPPSARGGDARQRIAQARNALVRAPQHIAYRKLLSGYDAPGGYRRMYFYHLRKTAGTSLVRAMLALGGEDPGVVHRRMTGRSHLTRSGRWVFANGDARLIRSGRYLFAWSHKPAHLVRLPPDTFRIVILRDPVERVLSLYRYLADDAAEAGLPFAANQRQRSMAADGLSAFLDRVPTPSLLAQLYAFSAAGDLGEAARAIAACELCFFTEEFNAGLAELSRRMDLHLEPRRERVSVPTEAPSPDELERLRKMVAPEYELFEQLAVRSGT